MSKERLEEIKQRKSYLLDLQENDDINWLIEQAERVWELEKQNKELLEGLATIGNAIHEGDISGRGTDENLILEVVDKNWRNRND